MANPRLFLNDFFDCEIRLTHMTSDFAYLEFEYENKTYSSQLAINMKAPLEGKPLMAGILERDPLIHRYFYIGKICKKIERLELSDEGAITIGNTNHLGHTFDLTIPGKNSEVKIPWYIFQEEKEHYDSDEKPEQNVFFECDQSGEITTPEKAFKEPIYVPWKRNDESKSSDENLQKLKGATLFKINYPYQRFYFRKDNELLELRAMNPVEFQGLFPLKQSALEEQFPRCEWAVQVCMYAQLLDKKVTTVTRKNNGDLFIDFDNKTTLFVFGDPAYDSFNDDSLWDLISPETGEWLSTYIAGTELAERKQGEISESALLDNLKEQVRLQREIIEAFAKKYPEILDSKSSNKIPMQGQIECDKSVWEFRRDSEGYSFIDRKANREMTMYRDFQNPNNLEAWRIHRYL
ncbi:hypothetical protein KA183_18890, partial [bacterium]|nr:hypothetical protein [bacterium]